MNASLLLHFRGVEEGVSARICTILQNLMSKAKKPINLLDLLEFYGIIEL